MRIGEIAALQLEWIDLKKDPVEIILPASITKTKTSRIVFTTQECARLIKEYVGHRRKGPLFPNVHDPKRNSSTASLTTMVCRYLRKSGLRERLTPESPMHKFHMHSTRKWFYSKAISSGLAPNFAEMLLGHNIGLDAHYLRADKEKLAAEYAKIEGNLTFLSKQNGQLRKTVDDQSERIKQLEEQLAALRGEIGRAMAGLEKHAPSRD